ncbi:MAG TPA: class I SAM-dependent methyltransferase [Actinomycetota bacterium]|nr:class I SAM-dependent methyltransferase [Actinomycetota bacterium]
MLTVDYDILEVDRTRRVLDIGCGAGRHSFEALLRGASVVAADLDDVALKEVAQWAAAIVAEGRPPAGAALQCVRANVLRLPFGDAAFDRVIASEIMEHVVEDEAALRELYRVLTPGGLLAVTVPRTWPEQVCWKLSSDYHAAAGGHVRIYRRSELEAKVARVGLRPFGHHHAHALHSPYWWLKCAVGVKRDTRLTNAYHSFLAWDIINKPRVIRWVEKALNPLMGKSLVVYARKPR